MGQSRKREESWMMGQEGLGRKDLERVFDFLFVCFWSTHFFHFQFTAEVRS